MSASSPRRRKTARADGAPHEPGPAESWRAAAERHAVTDDSIRPRTPAPTTRTRTRPAAKRPAAAELRDPALPSEERAAERPIAYIVQNLERAYGVPVNKWTDWDPLDMLVATILSQATSDTNSDRTWEALKRRFPTWDMALRARERTLADTIRTGGLANQKARVIRRLLRQLKERTGALTLEFLRDMPVDEAARFLSSFAGVGPKTVACTLLFSCDKETFPLDTHIFRILRRVGLLPARCSDERAHQLMRRLVPAGKFYSFHVNLIRHGRRVCRPRDPLCEQCPVVEYCDYGNSSGDARAAAAPPRVGIPR